MSQIGFNTCAKATVSKCVLLVLPLIVCGCSAPVPKSDLKSPPRSVQYAQGPGPYNFDCDATSDHYDQLIIRLPGGQLQVTGTFRFLTNRGVEQTYPFVTLGLISAAGDSAVLLGALATNGDTTRFSFGRGTTLDMEFAKEAFTFEAIPFALKIDQVGKVTGSVDGIDLPGGRNALGFAYLRLTCSTAHVRFLDVTLVPLK